MDNSTPQAIDNKSSLPGMPSWLAKSHSRYDDDDDIQFSLPTGDDGAFFSLHFGDKEEALPDPSPHKSTFDKINEELGFSKVASSSGAVGLGISPSRGSGLCLTAELQQYSLRGEEENTYQPRARKRSIAQQGASLPKFHIGGDDLESDEDLNTLGELKKSNLIDRSIKEESSQHLTLAQDLNNKLSVIAENKKLGILSKVQNYFLRTEPTTPAPSISNSPKAIRKTSAPVSQLDLSKVEHNSVKPFNPKSEDIQFYSAGAVVQDRKMNYNAYFYRPDQDKSNKKVALTTSAVKLNNATDATKDLNQTTLGAPGNTTEPAVSPKGYRPKPSRLREMNFWAPTSM